MGARLATVFFLLALIAVGLLVGTAANFTAGFLAIPLALLAIGVGIIARAGVRARGGAEPEPDSPAEGEVRFTARDRETLV